MIDPAIRLDRRAPACMQCERVFSDGETIVSAITPGEEEQSFLRRDLCEACFEAQGGAEGVHSLWRSRQPERIADPHRVDFELAGQFLERLLREKDPAQAELAWVLSLLLARKRRVKLHERRDADGRRLALLAFPGSEEDLEVELAVPDLRAIDVDRLQHDLARLFGFAAPDPSGEAAAPEGTAGGVPDAVGEAAPDGSAAESSEPASGAAPDPG
jgi:hypothetical protein